MAKKAYFYDLFQDDIAESILWAVWNSTDLRSYQKEDASRIQYELVDARILGLPDSPSQSGRALAWVTDCFLVDSEEIGGLLGSEFGKLRALAEFGEKSPFGGFDEDLLLQI